MTRLVASAVAGLAGEAAARSELAAVARSAEAVAVGSVATTARCDIYIWIFLISIITIIIKN